MTAQHEQQPLYNQHELSQQLNYYYTKTDKLDNNTDIEIDRMFDNGAVGNMAGNFFENFGGKKEGNVLMLRNISRRDAGVYVCRASNDIPPNDYKAVNITVQYRPYVTPAIKKLGQTLNREVIMDCHVIAYPYANVTWINPIGQNAIPSSESRMTSELFDQSGDSFTMRLSIKSVQLGDFGIYRCCARNKVGQGCACVQIYEYNKLLKNNNEIITDNNNNNINYVINNNKDYIINNSLNKHYNNNINNNGYDIINNNNNINIDKYVSFVSNKFINNNNNINNNNDDDDNDVINNNNRKAYYANLKNHYIINDFRNINKGNNCSDDDSEDDDDDDEDDDDDDDL
ncbi:hypothetical protein HELRODRAFT_168806 [Helobdella robusta]|uniref:Ig-like domain-containing protein n=1 Tax=Helobdella robusta TaxID=6412 RepID=T1F100_HELRO|nr:hypothetical protein HELRODRAFT_168806 [Helobdella robusta]ESO08887.1 hypothetical protein HELRODRAFT_168806 [Helobdella robusta]